MRSRSWLLACILFGCGFAEAAAKTDFSGEWHLNINRSEYANQPTPKQMTQKIAHKDPNLTVDLEETSPLDQPVKGTLKYVTDGREVTNDVLGNTVHATAKWEGKDLLVHSWADFSGRSIDLKDRWRLTENGTTLIVERHFEGPAGKIDQVIVFDKK